MPGPPPKKQRARRNVPAGGEWKPSPGSGWQHGDIPPAPDGLLAASRDTWASWFKGWWAANWSPDYLTQIRTAIQLYDAKERGDFKAITELRQWMDGIGVTFKGQQMLRWSPPKAEDVARTEQLAEPDGKYGYLRAVG